MPLDNFTIHRYRALKECARGSTGHGYAEPGDIFEATEDAGDVLVSVGAAERVTDDMPLGKPTRNRGPYKRRDLRAED